MPRPRKIQPASAGHFSPRNGNGNGSGDLVSGASQAAELADPAKFAGLGAPLSVRAEARDEVEAMSQMQRILLSLDAGAQQRVMAWLGAFYESLAD